jgi:hypothetical protein
MANFLRPKSWDKRYSQRRSNIYQTEEYRLQYDSTNSKSLVQAFLNHKHKSDRLDPPRSLTYAALGDYLAQGHLGRLPSLVPGENSENVILLDDRRHTSEHAPALRLKAEVPRGQVGHSRALSAKDYVTRTMKEKVGLIHVLLKE